MRAARTALLFVFALFFAAACDRAPTFTPPPDLVGEWLRVDAAPDGGRVESHLHFGREGEFLSTVAWFDADGALRGSSRAMGAYRVHRGRLRLQVMGQVERQQGTGLPAVPFQAPDARWHDAGTLQVAGVRLTHRYAPPATGVLTEVYARVR